MLIHTLAALQAAGLPTEKFLAEAVTAIGEVLDYIDVGILTIDPARPEQLVLRASNYAGFPDAVGNYRQPVQGGLIGRAMRAGQQVVIENVASEPDYWPVPGLAIRAEIITPLNVRGRVEGVLNIESLHAITPAEAETLAQAAKIIEALLGGD